MIKSWLIVFVQIYLGALFLTAAYGQIKRWYNGQSSYGPLSIFRALARGDLDQKGERGDE